ncbi:PAS domain-containing sensor histidine kinase [Candidatus Synchoanobacter obligatus]|uniref:histidine kinase n=1 Tax=Candidatus Synchoanobacter obligatus TaxID=2919597 RepID=A0ABT1L4F3_9GAMM|nr:PAS domain-containing sensor histidine kinase [Candidatus Synchoanobacter obligatus]
MGSHSQLVQALQKESKLLQDKVAFYELALDHYPQQIWALDEEGNIIFVNQSLKRLFLSIAQGDVKEFVGSNLYDFMETIAPKPVAEMLRRNDEIAIRGQGTMVFEEAVQVDDEVRTYLSYKKGIVSLGDNKSYLLGVSVDITERKLMENEMLAMMREMRLADRTKRTFIQNFRHDLKTPISNIIGAADLMLHSQDTTDQAFFLETIKSSGMNLMNHIEQLTDVSMSDQSVLPLNINDVDIRQEIKMVLDSVEAIARAKKLEIQVAIKDSLPEKVKTDQVRFHRVLANLVSNALKYTSQGSVTIEAGCIHTTQGSVLEIQVIDTGIGIEEKFQRLIFSPMMRLKRGENTSDGAGLGLSIVREFLDDLSGQISVQSVVDSGSRFIVMIPFSVHQA